MKKTELLNDILGEIKIEEGLKEEILKTFSERTLKLMKNDIDYSFKGVDKDETRKACVLRMVNKIFNKRTF